MPYTAQTASYPTSVPTVSAFGLHNNDQSTQTTASITNTGTTLTIPSTTGFETNMFIMLRGGNGFEICRIDGVPSSTTLTIARALDGTGATPGSVGYAHDLGTLVKIVPPALSINKLIVELRAGLTELGATGSQNFVRRDGTLALTANWNVGAFSLLNVGRIGILTSVPDSLLDVTLTETHTGASNWSGVDVGGTVTFNPSNPNLSAYAMVVSQAFTISAGISVTEISAASFNISSYSLGAGASISTASTVLIQGAPTGSASFNAALYVKSGISRFDGEVRLGDGSFSSGHVLFTNGNGKISSDSSNLIWDNTKKTFLIGTNSRQAATAESSLEVKETYSPAANADAWAAYINPTFQAQSSGTHAIFAGLYLDRPTLAGTGTVTDAVTLFVRGEPQGGTITGTKLALYVFGGNSRIRDRLQVGDKTSPDTTLDVQPLATAPNSSTSYLAFVAQAANVDVSGASITQAFQTTIGASTLTAGSAKTVTNAASLYIGGAPAAGTNVTITNRYALWVANEAARFDGTVLLGASGTLTRSGSGTVTWTFPDATGTVALLSLAQTWTAAQTLNNNVGLIGKNVAGTPFNLIKINASDEFDVGEAGLHFLLKGNRFRIGITDTSDSVKLYVGSDSDAPVEWGTTDRTKRGRLSHSVSGVVIDTSTAHDLLLGSNSATVLALKTGGNAVVGANSTANDERFRIVPMTSNLQATTAVTSLLSDSGSTTISSTPTSVLSNYFNAVTYTKGSAHTITNAATVYVNGPPVAGGSISITNSYAMWIDSGLVRFDGSFDLQNTTDALGGGATATLGTIGGGGPVTAGQNAWIRIKIDGVNAWIPYWR